MTSIEYDFNQQKMKIINICKEYSLIKPIGNSKTTSNMCLESDNPFREFS